MKALITIIAIILLALPSCVKDNFNPNKDFSRDVTITQGVWGLAFTREGNCKAPIDNRTCKETAKTRDVFIYKATTEASAVKATGQGFYQSLRSEYVKTIQSKNNGFFETSLDTGTYSFFVKEEGNLYNNYISDGIIGKVTVEKDKATQYILIIDHKATY
jgi:hypothetical protein